MAEVRTTSSTGGQKGVKLGRFDLIPTGPLTELAEHFGVGASKYADHQWRNGYEWSKSYAALQRHLTAFWSGLDYDTCSNDPEGCSHVDADGEPFTAVREDACFNHTGSHHMAAVAWHAFALLEFKDHYPEHDDRHRPTAPEEDDEDPDADFDGRIYFAPIGTLPPGWTNLGYTDGDKHDPFGPFEEVEPGTMKAFTEGLVSTIKVTLADIDPELFKLFVGEATTDPRFIAGDETEDIRPEKPTRSFQEDEPVRQAVPSWLQRLIDPQRHEVWRGDLHPRG